MKRLLLVPMLVALPAAAHACAACGAGVDRNRAVFLFTTIMLSILPLLLVGAGLLYIALRSRERFRAEFTEREPPVGSPAGSPAGSGARSA